MTGSGESRAAAGYSGTPLPRKLGIRPGDVVGLVDAPDGIESMLVPLPEGAIIRRGLRGRRQMTLCFLRSRRDLEKRIGRMQREAQTGGLWLAWPKKSSGMQTDLSESDVRSAGLAAGLVDFKICAIDSTWSGLRFAPRRT
ncbi:MAG: DUF3052 domain-containing protein [Gemmatimonadetes bacterium]|nr:DUF3052 domain-containing protein [Gemmatimonadota bacterium]